MANINFSVTDETTLIEWLHYWFNTYKLPVVKSTTRDDYLNTIDNHIAPNIGDIPLVKLTSDDLQRFFNEERDHGNLISCGEMSKKSIRNMRNTLNSALIKAVDLDIIPKNPMHPVEIQPLDKPEMTILTPEEENKIIKHLLSNNFKGKYDFAIFLALKLGLRNGEAAALKFGSFDLSKKSVYIQKRITRVKNLSQQENAPKTYLEISTPKSKQSIREIPFNDRFAAITQEYFNSCYPRSNHKDFYIFLSDTGSAADPTTISKYFQTMLREIGIKKKVRFHDLRHTFATRAIEKKVDIKTLSVLLGHTSVQFTLDRYAHVLGDQKRSAMDTMLSDL